MNIRRKEYLLGQYFLMRSFVAFGENAHDTFRTFLFRDTFPFIFVFVNLEKFTIKYEFNC